MAAALLRLPTASPLQLNPQRAALPPAGLQQPAHVRFRPATPDQAIGVASEQQLRTALGRADLGWRDRRAVQLTADIQLSNTLVIQAPIRLQGHCPGAQGGRCTLRGAGSGAGGAPLVHIVGPGAVVKLANLELVGGVGSGSLAGGITASNHSIVDLVAVRLAGHTGASGGAARIDSHARLALTGCEVVNNMAQVQGRCCACWACSGFSLCETADDAPPLPLVLSTLQDLGGAVYVHSGVLHLDQTSVRGNIAPQGGGITLAGSSRLTASWSQLSGNRLSVSSDQAGADLLLADGNDSVAYLEPMPKAGSLSGESHTATCCCPKVCQRRGGHAPDSPCATPLLQLACPICSERRSSAAICSPTGSRGAGSSRCAPAVAHRGSSGPQAIAHH